MTRLLMNFGRKPEFKRFSYDSTRKRSLRGVRLQNSF